MVVQELKPKDQACLLTNHEYAGQTFHLVNGRLYLLIINLFREGGNMLNPIKRVNHTHQPSRIDYEVSDCSSLPGMVCTTLNAKQVVPKQSF
jgi:hypothetical protein